MKMTVEQLNAELRNVKSFDELIEQEQSEIATYFDSLINPISDEE